VSPELAWRRVLTTAACNGGTATEQDLIVRHREAVAREGLLHDRVVEVGVLSLMEMGVVGVGVGVVVRGREGVAGGAVLPNAPGVGPPGRAAAHGGGGGGGRSGEANRRREGQGDAVVVAPHRVGSFLVDEAAAGAVGAGADGVEGLTDLGLVLGMPEHRAQLLPPMRELALGAIAAGAGLHERSAELRFVQILRIYLFFDVQSGGSFGIEAAAAAGGERRGLLGASPASVLRRRELLLQVVVRWLLKESQIGRYGRVIAEYVDGLRILVREDQGEAAIG